MINILIIVVQATNQQYNLMKELLINLELYCYNKFNITYLMYDIDETLKEWQYLLQNAFQIIGQTSEYLSGFGINATEQSKKSNIKRWLDPRDFSTLLFFKQGNTSIPINDDNDTTYYY